MRIAQVIINANQREGTARAVVEVAGRLAERHDVHLYARSADNIDLSKIRWHFVPGISRPEVANFVSFVPLCAWMLRAYQWTLVHSAGCNFGCADVFTIQNIQRAKVKVMDRLVREEDISVARRLSRWLHLRITCLAEMKFYSQRPGKRKPMFLPVSRGVEAELRSNYDIGSAIVHIVPNAADAARFHPLSEAERQAWRIANGVPRECALMLFAGGEWARKGLDLALKALAMLQRSDAVLFVAGDDPDRARFEHLVGELGVSAKVTFGGFRRDIAEAMGAADLFLFPSWYEAFSLATIEAAACGLAVVGTRINGAEDFICEGYNGAFIEHEPEQIASVLNRLLSDHGKLRDMGECARKIVEEHYTWDIVARKTEDAYYDYLDSCGRPVLEVTR